MDMTKHGTKSGEDEVDKLIIGIWRYADKAVELLKEQDSVIEMIQTLKTILVTSPIWKL